MCQLKRTEAGRRQGSSRREEDAKEDATQQFPRVSMRVSALLALGLLPLLFGGPLPSSCSELVLKRDLHDECRADDPSCPNSFRQCTTVERLQAAMVGFLGITAVGLGIAMAPFSAGGEEQGRRGLCIVASVFV